MAYQTVNPPTISPMSEGGETVHLQFDEADTEEFPLVSPFTPDYKSMALEMAYLTPRRKGAAASAKSAFVHDDDQQYFFQNPEMGEQNRLISPQRVSRRRRVLPTSLHRVIDNHHRCSSLSCAPMTPYRR